MTKTFATANLYRLNDHYPWIGRRSSVVSLLNGLHANAIACQETPNNYHEYLLQNLEGPWNLGSDHINCPVLYRSDLARKIETRPFTLKGTERNRYGSGVILEDLYTGERFCVVSWHPSSSKEKNAASDRPRQTEQLWSGLVQWGVTDLPLAILGDTNDSARVSLDPATPAMASVAQVMHSHDMTDALEVLNTEALFTNIIYGTSTGWAPAKKNNRHIDRCYANKFWEFVHAEQVLTGLSADHNFLAYSMNPAGVLVPPPVVEPDPPVHEYKPTYTAEYRAWAKLRPAITTMYISKVNAAKDNGYMSRYTAQMQLLLKRPTITGKWRLSDEETLDAFRKERKIPLGAVGMMSLPALMERAKSEGRKTMPIVNK